MTRAHGGLRGRRVFGGHAHSDSAAAAFGRVEQRRGRTLGAPAPGGGGGGALGAARLLRGGGGDEAAEDEAAAGEGERREGLAWRRWEDEWRGSGER